MSQFLVFRRFNTAEQAGEIITLLQEHNIPVQYEQEVRLVDNMYGGQNFDPPHLVRVPGGYFTKANDLLKNQLTVSLDDVEPDYYLLSFTKEELKDVILKKDEWGDYDYALAKKLLEKQGITYTPEQLKEMGHSRLKTLAKPQDLPSVLVIIGFCSPVLIFAPVPSSPVFSFIGFFIGGFVLLTKKTLPDGARIPAFTAKAKGQAKWMMITGVILTALCWYILGRLLGRN
jgi:hypothetical protein